MTGGGDAGPLSVSRSLPSRRTCTGIQLYIGIRTVLMTANSSTAATNPTAATNCPARAIIHSLYSTGIDIAWTHLNLILGDTCCSEPVVPAVHGFVVHQDHLEVVVLLA